MECPECRRVNPDAAAYCMACGHKLPARPDVMAERRHLTLMFADLVGSTALSARLDPEEWSEVVSAYQRVCAEVVAGVDGHIGAYLGDGILAYFGYPRAHEDDARRAVRAGLDLLAARGSLNDRLERDLGVRIDVRVGIHTGLTVVGETGGVDVRPDVATGEGPNVASRIQELARPNTVVVSENTYRLSAGYFEFDDLGHQALKGLSRPVRAYEVVAETEARDRLDAAETLVGLTPLVGRAQELRFLREAWEATREGEGRVVLVYGEAGIGKSRLVRALAEEVAQQPDAWRLEARGSPVLANTPFHPVVDLLERGWLGRRGQEPDDQRAGLERLLTASGLAWDDYGPLFASLIGLPGDPDAASSALPPEAQKRRTMEGLLRGFLRQAAKGPGLLVVEDLHWVDPSTIELLTELLDLVPTNRVLVLLTFRPEFQPPWALRDHVRALSLTRLRPGQVEQLVGKLTAGHELPDDVVTQIAARTDGVPLFVEELTRMVVEASDESDPGDPGGPDPGGIPATLQESLMARLDRLSTLKDVAQRAAVLAVGREFPYELLRAVSDPDLDEEQLRAGLRKLVDAGFLQQQGLPPDAEYRFRHALIRDAAYESMLKRTRQWYHLRVAEILEQQPGVADTEPETLAHHYTAAGVADRAADHWQRAGVQSLQRFANTEAVTALTTALSLLERAPGDPQRELDLRVALGTALMAVRSYSAPEVVDNYARARDLSRRVEASTRLGQSLWGLWISYLTRGRFQAALEVAGELLRMAEQLAEEGLLVEAHAAVGIMVHLTGDLRTARRHFEEALRRHDPDRDRDHAVLYGHDPQALSLAMLALTLLWLGSPTRALELAGEGVAVARERRHPLTLGFALGAATLLHQGRGESEDVLRLADETIAVSTEKEMPIWLGFGQILRACALLELGRVEEGLEEVQAGVATSQRSAEGVFYAAIASQVADALLRAGQADFARLAVEQAFASVEASGERLAEAELHRVRGELARAGGDARAARSSFDRALAVAREQHARTLELRAALSLSRLSEAEGDVEQARTVLAGVYEQFTEGFDMPRLREAAAQLERLDPDGSPTAGTGGPGGG